MRLPRPPDLTTPARTLVLAVLTAAVAFAFLYPADIKWLPGAIGDTDDATRLVFVRELVAGRGWFDQHFLRLQPPLGVWFHWSRLIDGGLAGLYHLLALFLAPKDAELWMRLLWPSLWVVVAAWSTLWMVTALTQKDEVQTQRGAVLAATLLMMVNLGLYAQFHPGRIDHHNVQIALTLAALAGVMQPRTKRGWSAIIAGACTGLGLAVGLEALFFQALIAAFAVFRYLRDPREADWVSKWAGALVLSTVGFYVIETPPQRLALDACDAIAANLVFGVVAAGVGVLVAVRLSRHAGLTGRVLSLALAGAAGLFAYLGLYPKCLHGPFADVDMRIRSFWLDHVQEVANLPLHYTRHPDEAIGLAVPALFALIAFPLVALRRGRILDNSWQALGAIILVGAVVGWSAVRMGAYGVWFAMPVLAIAASLIAKRYAREFGLFAPVIAALILSPIGWSGLAVQARPLVPPLFAKVAAKAPAGAKPAAAQPAKKDPADYCFNAFAYADLARAPKGLTVSEIDLGPFVLAYTPSSSLSGPYHRMGVGIMAARSILIAREDEARRLIGQYGVTYVLECPLHANHADRTGLDHDALQRRLDRNDPPAWLKRISGPKSPVVAYEVAPLNTK